eukprot:scaffold1790_cov257-Pinguiococcus_pyrenoidosus.AAC.8
MSGPIRRVLRRCGALMQFSSAFVSRLAKALLEVSIDSERKRLIFLASRSFAACDVEVDPTRSSLASENESENCDRLK